MSWKRKEKYNMLKWEINPTISINGIKFGETKDKVRSTIGSEYREFSKSKFSKTKTDDFGFCHCFYDAQGSLEAIEFFENISLNIGNTVVFPSTFTMLKSIFDGFEFDGYGYINKKYSIGLTVDANDNVESILLGSPGYYDE